MASLLFTIFGKIHGMTDFLFSYLIGSLLFTISGKAHGM